MEDLKKLGQFIALLSIVSGGIAWLATLVDKPEGNNFFDRFISLFITGCIVLLVKTMVMGKSKNGVKR